MKSKSIKNTPEELEAQDEPMPFSVKVVGVTLLLFLFIIVAGGIYQASIYFTAKWRYDPWQIVCSSDGHYSFTEKDSQVHDESFPTEADARRAMEFDRGWEMGYYNTAERDAETKAHRKRKWGPCK